MARSTDVLSYPTHTRASHPGWYSRLTYLHTLQETFPTWDGVGLTNYDMFKDQFSTSVNKKGNYLWPANYWKPGMLQRIKGCFLINGVLDDRFDMTFGIQDVDLNLISIDQNNNNDHHLFKTTNNNIPVNFEWSIYHNHTDAGDSYFGIQGFYHYEDLGFFGSGAYNQGYHHIPFYTQGFGVNITKTTWPYMLIKPTSHASITLLNLTIEELGG